MQKAGYYKETQKKRNKNISQNVHDWNFCILLYISWK